MLNDPEIDKLIIYGLAGACAVLLLAVLILAFKRNVYYVNDKGQEIPKPKKSKKQKAPTEAVEPEVKTEVQTPAIEPEVPVVEAPTPAPTPVVEPLDLPEAEAEVVAEPQPTTVVPTIKDIPEAQPVEEVEQKGGTLEVPLAKPTTSPIKGALVNLTVNGKSEERAIDRLPCLIGRESASCDFVILEPAVSRRHARVLIANDELCIEDVSEHNGTFVNGTKLPSLGRIAIHEGDVISLGRATITIEKLLY